MISCYSLDDDIVSLMTQSLDIDDGLLTLFMHVQNVQIG